MAPLLSIVVPTKNRYYTLKYLVEMFLSMNLESTELVIQDNSDNNKEFEGYVQGLNNQLVRYFYCADHLSVCENCDLSILHSKGEYVCMIGDDDGVVRTIEDSVREMKAREIESLSVKVASYIWPDVHGVVYDKSSTLTLSKQYHHRYKQIDVDKVLDRVVRSGAAGLFTMPCVYHGIVKRTVLDQVHEKTGTFFPGPSPDMANAVALSLCSPKHFYYDAPIIVAGHSAKSAGGMGAKHKHVDRIEDLAFLPKQTAAEWCNAIPKYWTAETIYAESAVKSIKHMGFKPLLDRFGFAQLYGRFIAFHLPLSKLAFPYLTVRNFVRVAIVVFNTCCLRGRVFIKNFLLKKNKQSDLIVLRGIANIKDCEQAIFGEINK